MPTQAIAATGIIVTFDGTPVPEVTGFSDLGGTATLVDVTAHDTSGSWSARIPTFLDGGTYRMSCNYVPGNAVHIAMWTAFTGRLSKTITVQLPDTGTTTWTFAAYTTRYRLPTLPVNGVLPLEVEFTTDGAVAFS